MPRYSNDPRFITAKFDSTCGRRECQGPIKKGERVFYYPSSRTCYCPKDECAGQACRDFAAAAADEDGGYCP